MRCSDVRCGDGFQYQYGEASGRIASAHHLQNGTNLGEQSRRTHPLRRPHPHLYTTPSTIVVALSITRLVYRRTRRRNTASECPPPHHRISGGRRLDGARLGEHLQRQMQLVHGSVVILVGVRVRVLFVRARVRARVRAAVSWTWNCSALEAEEHSRCASTIAIRSGLKDGPRVGSGGGAPKPGMPPGGMTMCCAGGGGG